MSSEENVGQEVLGLRLVEIRLPVARPIADFQKRV